MPDKFKAFSNEDELPSVPLAVRFNPDEALDLLSPAQSDALEALMEGESIRSAAQKLGTSRNTITRWIKSNPAFRAAYNAWRQELAESAEARLARTLYAAVDAVDKAVTAGDAKIALALIKYMGTKPSLPGPANLTNAAHEIEAIHEEERTVLDRRFLAAGVRTLRGREELEDIMECVRERHRMEQEVREQQEREQQERD